MSAAPTSAHPNYDHGLLDTAISGIGFVGLLTAFLLICAFWSDIIAALRSAIGRLRRPQGLVK